MGIAPIATSREGRPAIPPPDDRAEAGKTLRERRPRSAHAAWAPPVDRPDPIALLEASNRGRLPGLAALRYGRMLESPFAFLRGASVVMARDLAVTPVTGIRVHLCGDAHAGNIGGYASPERNLVFDLNDFDETLPGPWEWDLKRLVASLVVLGRANGLRESACEDAAVACARSYRERIRGYGAMPHLDVWYAAIDDGDTLDRFRHNPKPIEDALDKARRRTNEATLPRLAESAGDGYRIADDPPLTTHRRDAIHDRLPEVLSAYRLSLPEERRLLLNRYRVVDVARKVVGIGSVGLRCYALLLQGAADDPLFLQMKEARPSVLAPPGRANRRRHHGKRIVVGQRVMQAASDIFLGWTRCGRVDYYVRQLRDMKTTVDLEALDGEDLAAYGDLCGWVLARAHACSGDAACIGGYLGKRSCMDKAMAAFAAAYADQTERDHAALVAAVAAGRVQATAEA